MLGTELSVLHGLFHLVLDNRSRSSYLHFTDEETETWRGEVTCPRSPTAGSQQPDPRDQLSATWGPASDTGFLTS